MYIEFEAGQKFAKTGADISDDHETFKDAGYILGDHDLVIDIDCLDKGTIEKMISIFDINTQTVETDRGYHLYFKKPSGFTKGANRVSALGFPIELKHNVNTKNGITIKRDGVLRTIKNEGVREDLPEIFSMNKRFANMIGYDEGDGRNDAIFKHRNQLVNVEGWERMLRFINENIFADPLPEEELQVLSRDMSIEAEKDKEPEIAEYMMNRYKIIKYEGNLYFKIDDKFEHDDDKLIRLIFDKVGSQKTFYVDEILKQIDYRCKVEKDDKLFDIKFKNGILRQGKFIEVDYEDFTPYVVDIDYIEDAEPVSYVDNYVKHLTQSDDDYTNLIYEILAHCFIVDRDFKRMLAKFFIFIGGGGNGKGTLLQIIKQILGQNNVTGMSINNMSDERYLVSMKGKLANLGDDIQDEPIDNQMMKNLKNISTCDFIEGRELYKQSKPMTLSCSLIFTSNHVLKSFEKGDAYKRRVMWLPMFSIVREKDKDINFISKLTSEASLEYWVSNIIKAYFRLYSTGQFTQSDIVDNYNEEYHRENNTSLMFLDDYVAEDLDGRRPPEIYEEYENWTEENGSNLASRKMIAEAIVDMFNLEIKVAKINGKSARVYRQIDNQ